MVFHAAAFFFLGCASTVSVLVFLHLIELFLLSGWHLVGLCLLELSLWNESLVSFVVILELDNRRILGH
jgi:hypothetical protein